MGSVLDIIQSIIIAGVIALLVLGVHLMTMKSSSEHRAIQQMQSMADMAVTILQEEIRFLHSFVADSVRVNTNTLYFRDTDGTIVIIEATTDTLTVSKYERGAEIVSGQIQIIPTPDSARVQGNPAIPLGSLIQLTSALGEGELKIINRLGAHAENRRVFIKGTWDMTYSTMPEYTIYQTTEVYKRHYNLRLLDKSNDGTYVFNMVDLAPDGTPVNIAQSSIDTKDIDMIRVNISVQNRPEDLYQDVSDEYVIDLEQDFFLRGFRLPSAGG